MLIQLLPDQVGRYWEQIRYSIAQAFPPTVDQSVEVDYNRLLQSALAGQLVVWTAVDEATKNIVGILTTTVTEDPSSGSRSLLIYSVFVTAEKAGKRVWEDGFKTIQGYAKKCECTKIIGFTQVDSIKRIVEFFGGRAKWTLIEIDVK